MLSQSTGPLVISLFGLVVSACARQVQLQQWKSLALLPLPRQEHSTVALNETAIAVVGGMFRTGNSSYETGLVTTDSVQVYDIPSDSWHNATTTPFKVNHPNVAVVRGQMYLLGGLVDSQVPPGLPVNWVASGESHVYDPITDVWTNLQPMPPGMERGSAVVGVSGDLIYLAGGMTVLQEAYQDAITSVIAYNISADNWQRLPAPAANIPEGRQHVVGGVVGHALYVIGGRWFGQAYVKGTVFELDLNDQSAGWKTDPTSMPTARGGLCGDFIGQKYYTFGGEGDPHSPEGVFDQAEVYDSGTQTWTSLTAMPVPRHGTHAVAINNTIYIPGGGQQEDGKRVEIGGVVSYFRTSDRFDAFQA